MSVNVNTYFTCMFVVVCVHVFVCECVGVYKRVHTCSQLFKHVVMNHVNVHMQPCVNVTDLYGTIHRV